MPIHLRFLVENLPGCGTYGRGARDRVGAGSGYETTINEASDAGV